MNEQQKHIYALVCPITSRVRYVGATVSPESRYKNLMGTASATPSRIEWMRWLTSQGEKPQMIILEICGMDVWRDVEDKWIQAFLPTGLLTNRIYRGCKNPSIVHFHKIVKPKITKNAERKANGQLKRLA